jgi:hypothetical protein
MLLISMMTDMARIRTAMGDPMSKAEIDAYAPYAADNVIARLGLSARKIATKRGLLRPLVMKRVALRRATRTVVRCA